MARESLGHPRQRVGGGSPACDEQDAQRDDDLVIGQRVIGFRGRQEAAQAVGRRARPGGAAGVHLLARDRLDLGVDRAHVRIRRPPPAHHDRRGEADAELQRVEHLVEAIERVLKALRSRRVGHAEHGGDDHVASQAVRQLGELHRRAERPAAHRGLGLRDDPVFVAT